VSFRDRHVDQLTQEERRHHRQARDHEDRGQDPDQMGAVGPPVAPDPLEDLAVEIGPVALLVIPDVTPPAAMPEHDVSPPTRPVAPTRWPSARGPRAARSSGRTSRTDTRPRTRSG